MNDTPTRPALRWHGGKWRLAPWIIGYFPQHRNYVEPYAGGASVLLLKPRSPQEVYNDLDGDVVNLFRVLRDPEQAAALREQLALTPFSREEFLAARDAQGQKAEPVERARQLLARSAMGFGSNSVNIKARTSFRSASRKWNKNPAAEFSRLPECLVEITNRLRGVIIENRPALKVILQQDTPETLFYVDPPYIHSTRRPRQRGNYQHEMTDSEHGDMLGVLCSVKGMVVLSGYPSKLYDTELKGWERFECKALADGKTDSKYGSRDRIEVLWLNQAAQKNRAQMSIEDVQ